MCVLSSNIKTFNVCPEKGLFCHGLQPRKYSVTKDAPIIHIPQRKCKNEMFLYSAQYVNNNDSNNVDLLKSAML